MPRLDLTLNGEGCWPDLTADWDAPALTILRGPDAPPLQVALLRRNMTSGNGTVWFRIDLPDGRVVVTETSLALLSAAVRAMEIKAGIDTDGR